MLGRIDHNSLGISLHWVGVCLLRVGKNEDARPWFERAMEAKRCGDVFGRIDKESLQTSLKKGAECLRQLGRLEEAEAWEAEAATLEVEQAQAEGT